MPWRKYSEKRGKHGPIYNICKGITVRFDKDQKWRLFVEKYGHRSNTTFGSDRKALTEAVKAAEAIARKISFASPEEQKPKAPKFADYARQYLEDNSGRWHPSTYERYDGILETHILTDSTFKNLALDEINRQTVKRLLLKVYKHRSPATVELVHIVVNSVFNEAIEEGLVAANPASGLLKKILPKLNERDQKEPAPLDMKERGIFLDYARTICNDAELLILKTMLFAGVRLGEVLSVRLGNFDFNKMTYHVTESYKRYCFGKPKFGKKRFVDLPVFLVDELKAYITQLKRDSLQKGTGGEVDLLFIDPTEDSDWPYSQRKIQRLVPRVCKGTGLSYRNPHDLRHTYATILLMAHLSPAYVQKQLGHSSIKITVDTYGHWISGEGRHGLENALLGENGNRIFSHIKREEPEINELSQALM